MNKRMKVNTRELFPNPYRDMKNYPINREKVDQLKASITETGFWDNLLSRERKGKIQIAYGHHRLLALQEMYPKGCNVDIPVKDLSDSLMIKIMVNENMDDWKQTPGVIDESIKAVYLFLKEHPEEILIKIPKRRKSPSREMAEAFYDWSPLAFQISEYLGKGWSEKKVYNTLNRLQATGEVPDERNPKTVKDTITGEKVEKKRVKIDKDSSHALPSGAAADNFVAVAEDLDLTIPQQKKVVKEILKSGSIGKSTMASTAQSVKYPSKKAPSIKKPKQELPTDFEQFLADLAGDIRRTTKGLENLSKVMHVHGDIIVDKIIAVQITTAMETMYYKAGNILKTTNIID